MYSGNYTVPVLYDKIAKRIVNNESSDIIRMLNEQFNHLAKNSSLNLYTEHLRPQIEELNAWIYPNINNGVYRCGFAKSQEAYEEAYDKLFEHLEKAEAILSKSRYLTGPTVTEADIRLFVTLVRFDPAYVVHFKTNKKRLIEYPNLFAFTRDIYQLETAAGGKVSTTVNLFQIKQGYFKSPKTGGGESNIVPKGFDIDYEAPHGRESL